MKRTAESQLTKDNADNDDEIEETDSFKKADAELLAARKIKALPKRPPSASIASVNSQPPSIKTEIAGPSRFGNFSGFGAISNSTDGKPPSFFSSSSFAGFGAATGAISGTTSSDIPSASILPSISNFQSSPTFQQDSTPLNISKTVAPVTSSPNSAQQKFYISLRGLNVSISKSVNDSIKKDPFVDLSAIFENYRLQRETIQKEYDSIKVQPHKTTATPHPPAPLPSFTMPIPPTKFTFTGTTTATPSASEVSPWPASTSSSTEEKQFKPSFSFGASKPHSTGLFTFGSSTGKETALPETTAIAQTDEENAAASEKLPSILSNATVTPSFFKPTTTPMTPGFASFFPSSNPKSSSTAFGSSLTAKPMTATNKGNIGNPVGFSFGNANLRFPASLSSTTTTTNAPPASDDFMKASTKQEEEGGEATSQANAESENKEESLNPYDKDSVGEEDEETLFETKSRAYLLHTGEESEKVWAPVGSGQLKLKKKKDGTRRRLLMRSSSSGKIIVNTLVVPGFKLTVEGKHISFIAPNEKGSADLFKLRVVTEADAKEWEAKVSEQ